MKRLVGIIPNTITCLNLVSGAIACIMAFSATATFGPLTGCQWAFIFIGAAALFDFCDGAAARALKAYSAMGKELDSLCDLVSFGLAPAFLLYNTILTADGGGSAWVAWLSLYIPVMGALRLAKFNIDERQTTSFIGLPIPANAIFWVGMIAWINAHGYPGNTALVILILFEASLMVSSLPMFSLKFKNFDWRENFRRYVIILAAILFVISEGLAGLMWTIVLYIVISAVGKKNTDIV